MDLERGPLSLVSTIEELLERKSSSFGLETEITAIGILRADHATPLYPQKLALTSPTGGCHSVGIVRLRTKATELLLLLLLLLTVNIIDQSAFNSPSPFHVQLEMFTSLQNFV
jgi:hypothetical protein